MTSDEKLAGVLRMMLFAIEEPPGTPIHKLFTENAKEALDAWLESQQTSRLGVPAGAPIASAGGSPESADAD